MKIFYRLVRPLILGGLPTKHVTDLLDSTEKDTILDLGCGDGFLRKHIKYKCYFGIDNDIKEILKAGKTKQKNESFLYSHVEALSDIYFNLKAKVVCYGLLHHLSDKSALRLLKRFRPGNEIITLDPVYNGHYLNNILCRFDKGSFVRSEPDMDDLIKDSGLRVIQKTKPWCNTRIAQYVCYKLRKE